MRMGADIVGENAVDRQPVTENIQYMICREPFGGRTQRAIEVSTMLLDFGCSPVGGGGLQSGDGANSGIEITRRVPDKSQRARGVGRFRIDMQNRSIPDPLFIIDLDGIIADGDDQIRAIDEALYICPP